VLIIRQVCDSNVVVISHKKLSKYTDIGFSFENLIASKLMIKTDYQADNGLRDKSYYNINLKESLMTSAHIVFS
jgi:hypothetical protein